MMDENLFKFLKAVNNCNSISEAAKFLFVSQPYLSRFLKEKEKQLGIELVDRKQKPIILTPAGKLVVKRLSQENVIHQKLQHELRILKHSYFQNLNIGLNRDLGTNISSDLIKSIKKIHPNLRISITSIETEEAEKKLLSGEIDLYLGKEIFNSDLYSEMIDKIGVSLIVPSSSKLFERNCRVVKWNESIFLKSIKREKLICQNSERLYSTAVNNYFYNNNIDINYDISAPDSTTMIQLCLMGFGICIAPNFFRVDILQKNKAEYNVVPIPTKDISFNLCISVNKSKYNLLKKDIEGIKDATLKKIINNKKYLKNSTNFSSI